MTRGRITRALVGIALIALVTVVATVLLDHRADAAGRPAARPLAPGPTAQHPLQGLRRLTVATIPPVPGMRFAVDGTEFVADSNGVATTLVTKDQRFAVRYARDAHLSVVTPTVEFSPGVRAKFSGWSGKGQYRNDGPVPEEYQRATFNIEYLTSFSFTTPGGAAVAPRTLDTMRLHSSTGARLLLRRFTPVWLSGSLAASGPSGLRVRAVSYAIETVTTRGASVVHRGQQVFFPSRREIVSVPLLLFDVRFVARDALFGDAAGSAMTLEYPDGTTRRLPLDRYAARTIAQLPRGTYQARISGAGPTYSQQLTVSSGARVDLDVVTWVDTGLLVGFVLLVLLALMIVGRAMRRRNRRKVELDLVELEDAERPSPEMVRA